MCRHTMSQANQCMLLVCLLLQTPCSMFKAYGRHASMQRRFTCLTLAQKHASREELLI
jgi:hypothetical protein